MKKLFFVPVPVFMSHIISYQLSFCKDDVVVLAVDRKSFFAHGYNNYLERFKAKGIFDDVIYCDLFIDRVHLPQKSDEIEDYVTVYFDEMILNAECDLMDYEEIILVNDDWCADINLYFNYKSINYRWLEPSYDSLMIGAAIGYPKLLKDEFNRLNAESAIAKYARPLLFRESDSSINIMKGGIKDYELWSLAESIKNISNDDLEGILECYSSNLDFEKEISLFIVNSYGASQFHSDIPCINNWGQRVIGYQEYKQDEMFSIIYLLLLDIYASDDKVYIKFHPNDPMSENRKIELYPSNVRTFLGAPFEFACEYFLRKKIRIKNLIAMDSTCVKHLNSELYSHNTFLGLDFYKTMHYYASLYVLTDLLKFMSISKVAASREIAHQLQSLSKGKLDCMPIKGYEDANAIMKKGDIFVIFDAVHHGFNPDAIRSWGDNIYFCFLNVGFSDSFRPSELFLEFIPIELVKISKGLKSPLHYNEIFWIYTSNKDNRRILRRFHFKKDMPYSNMLLCTKEHTIQEEMDLADKIVKKSVVDRIKEECQRFSNVEKGLWNVAIEGGATCVAKLLRQYKDINGYLSLLSIIKDKYMIICAVKDTPGSSINVELLNAIRSMGFSKFTTELWRMYVGIVGEGKVIFDACGAEREVPIDIKCDNSYFKTHIHVISKSWRKGNVANIYINGEDYSANVRGINIVVYDPKERVVLDSIGFDGHERKYRFARHRL